MSRKHSPINDLYGNGTWNVPPSRRRRVWPYLLLVLAALVVYQSVRPVMRLRPDPPPAVVGPRSNSGEVAYREQQRMARACWDYARQYLQDTYPYGRPLPPSPFLGFVKTPALRMVCWQRLRAVWMQPEAWSRSYAWSTDWLTDPQGSFQRTLRALWNSLGIAR